MNTLGLDFGVAFCASALLESGEISVDFRRTEIFRSKNRYQIKSDSHSESLSEFGWAANSMLAGPAKSAGAAGYNSMSELDKASICDSARRALLRRIILDQDLDYGEENRIGLAVPDAWGLEEKRHALLMMKEIGQPHVLLIGVAEAAARAFLNENEGFGGRLLIIDFGAHEVRLALADVQGGKFGVVGKSIEGKGSLDFEHDLAERIGVDKAVFRDAWEKAVEKSEFYAKLRLYAINPLTVDGEQALVVGSAHVKYSDMQASYDATLGEALAYAFKAIGAPSGDIKVLAVGGMHDFPLAVKQMRSLMKSGIGLADSRFAEISEQRWAVAYGAAIAASEWDGKAVPLEVEKIVAVKPKEAEKPIEAGKPLGAGKPDAAKQKEGGPEGYASVEDQSQAASRAQERVQEQPKAVSSQGSDQKSDQKRAGSVRTEEYGAAKKQEPDPRQGRLSPGATKYVLPKPAKQEEPAPIRQEPDPMRHDGFPDYEKDKRALTGRRAVINSDSVISIVIYRPYLTNDGRIEIREELVPPSERNKSKAFTSMPVAVDRSVELDIQGVRHTEQVAVEGEYIISVNKEGRSATLGFRKYGEREFSFERTIV